MKRKKTTAIGIGVVLAFVLAFSILPCWTTDDNYVQNSYVRFETDGGQNNQGPYTIVNGYIKPTPPTKEIVWYGEYDYVAINPSGSVNTWTWIQLPSTRTQISYVAGVTYTFDFNIFNDLAIRKTVTIGLAYHATITYNIKYVGISTNPHIYLYYSIDYCDAPYSGNTADKIYLCNGNEVSTAQWITCPGTPSSNGLRQNTLALGQGFLRTLYSADFYAGYWNHALYHNFQTGYSISNRDDDMGVKVDFGTVTAVGVSKDIYIGLYGDPHGIQPASPDEPELPVFLGPTAECSMDPPLVVTYDPSNPKDTVSSTVTAGQVYTFNASYSFDFNHSLTSYKWKFGDGTEVTTVSPVVTHTYNKTGQIDMTLEVMNSIGQSDTVGIGSVPPVGGISAPVDKLGLVAPYIGLASAVSFGAVATVVYIRRGKCKKEKQ